MANFILTFHGEMADFSGDPAEIEASQAAWGAWYGSIGADLIDGGAPIASHTAIGPDGNDTATPSSTLTGYTVIKADDVAAATKIAQGCPVLEYGSSVQISQTIDMA